MFLPRFSIRTVLYAAAAVAVVALVAAKAIDGAQWALALTIAILSLPVAWVVFVVFYAIAAGFAWVALRGDAAAAPAAYYPEPRPAPSTAEAPGEADPPPTPDR